MAKLAGRSMAALAVALLVTLPIAAPPMTGAEGSGSDGAPTAPPGASDPYGTPRYYGHPPLTWVDDQGRQYLFTYLSDSTVSGWIVDRFPSDGWGSVGGVDGRRVITFEAPAPGLGMSSQVAVSDAGILTALWFEAPCSTTPCDRWFATYDATGTPLGSTLVEADVSPPTGAVGRLVPDGRRIRPPRLARTGRGRPRCARSCRAGRAGRRDRYRRPTAPHDRRRNARALAVRGSG